MRRREFLGSAAASLLLTQLARSESLPADLRITRAVSFDLYTKRNKFAGKNARRGDHGDSSRDRMVRLYTNLGVEAIGRCWKDEEAVRAIVGTNPFADFDPASRRIESPVSPRTMVLWDLAGRLLKKPVYQLLGCKEGGATPVYDGSIYFADLLPQYADKWQDRFKEEIDMGMRAGHRGFKIKIGRGLKWMPREEGDARDVEVIETIRRHAGDDALLGVDANNGYDLPGIQRFLKRTRGMNLAFVEEPFPEKVDHCLQLKAFMAEEGLKTLLADGEGQDNLEVYRPFIDAKALDVLQGDMNGFGVEGILDEAAMARPQGILVAPHNWSSMTSLYLQAHVGLATPNFYRAEHDPLSSDMVFADGYTIAGGMCKVPDAPGFGLRIDEKKFQRVKVNFDLRA